MDNQTFIGFLLLAGLPLAIFAAMRMLAVAVLPARERLYKLCVELLDEGRLSERNQAILNKFMDRGLSFDEGWRFVRFAFSYLGEAMRGVQLTDTERKMLERLDPRLREVAGLFLISIAAANPVAVIIAGPISCLAATIEAARDHHTKRKQAITSHIFMKPQLI